MEARILRDDGTDVDFGEPGELYLRGKNVVMGYWNHSEATRETFLPGGWLRTGDRFMADAEGRFLYVQLIHVSKDATNRTEHSYVDRVKVPVPSLVACTTACTSSKRHSS